MAGKIGKQREKGAIAAPAPLVLVSELRLLSVLGSMPIAYEHPQGTILTGPSPLARCPQRSVGNEKFSDTPRFEEG
jgi:hypothetical protein